MKKVNYILKNAELTTFKEIIEKYVLQQHFHVFNKFLFCLKGNYKTLSWDAMIKMTDAKLDHITDVGIYRFMEKDMRVAGS